MSDSPRERRRVAALVAQYIQELSGGQNGKPRPVVPKPIKTAQPPQGA
jgi:hypothetical protein